MNRRALDKHLQHVSGMENVGQALVRRLAAPGLALVFLMLVAVVAASVSMQSASTPIIVIGAILAAYMALNIGANDVANNMGPTVGARALTMPAALFIAAIFEAAGALLAGGDVVQTISADLLVSVHVAEADVIRAMMSALLASAIWINFATYTRAPISTTHSIVGAVVGAGIAAAGPQAASWPTIAGVAGSWIITPFAGGIVAAILLVLTRLTISDRLDKVTAARKWVPVFVAIMTGTFALYMASKGLERVWRPGPIAGWVFGIFAAVVGWLVAVPLVRRQSQGLENRRKQVAKLFRVPLVIAAALLSFAHGANDVANAIGPLAAILSVIEDGVALPGDPLPFWTLAIGALGISAGLALFGPRLIRTVGAEITRLNEIRAYCVALSTAITVLIASAFGMPVSTTHIAIGAVFGVGFLREFLSQQEMRRKAVPRYARLVDRKALNATPEDAFANARDLQRRRLIRRRQVLTIFAAWTITLPCSAALGAGLYFALSLLIG